MTDIVMFSGHHNYEFIPHSHEVATVIVITNGDAQIDVDGDSYSVTAGDLVVIGANQVHSARPITSSGWEMRRLHAPTNLLSPPAIEGRSQYRATGFSSPVFPSATKAASLFLEMHRCTASNDDVERQHDQINEFCHWFRRNMDAFRPRPISRGTLDPELKLARELILRAAFNSDFISDIANMMGVSSYSLIRRFKRTFGISPHAWRMQVRASEAAQLLRHGHALADVAADCGFADQAHMTRIFKRVYGVTPGQYRILQ
jgi:AraC-like DNA-binding protein